MVDTVLPQNDSPILILQENWIVPETSHGVAGGNRKGKGLWLHNF